MNVVSFSVICIHLSIRQCIRAQKHSYKNGRKSCKIVTLTLHFFIQSITELPVCGPVGICGLMWSSYGLHVVFWISGMNTLQRYSFMLTN